MPLSIFIAKDLADLLSSEQMKKWWHEHKNASPWMPCSINRLFHDVNPQFVKLASDHNKQLDLLNGQMPNYEVNNNIHNYCMVEKEIIMDGVQ